MTRSRFLQIHTIHAYTAALLNRDDSGLAKRLLYGDVSRTRISSQCLKRHWRFAEDPHALERLDQYVESYRSRELVTKMIVEPLQGKASDDILKVLDDEFQKAVYGEKADKGKKSRQTLMLGEPEINWLKSQADELLQSSDDKKELQRNIKAWAKEFKDNIRAMREQTQLPGGLTAGLFGRMITSDPAANIEAPIHVAHSFTIHGEEAEGDYFTAVDDLKEDEDDSSADTIQETELTSGLFYGYVVVDIPGLIRNCAGDRALASRVLHNLVFLIAEVSPGAKLGSTAPYGRAAFMMIEAGNRQPRSLAAAWRNPVAPDLDAGVGRLVDHLAKLDKVYATGEVRRHLSLADAGAPGGSEEVTLQQLATWTAQRIEDQTFEEASDD